MDEEKTTYFRTEPMEIGDIMPVGEDNDIMIVVECNEIEEGLYGITVRNLPY